MAALPLLVAIGALLAVTVMADLDRVDEAERDATLGVTWGGLLDASQAVIAEQRVAIDALRGEFELNTTSAAGTPDADPLDVAGEATDASIATLREQLAIEERLGDPAMNQIGGALGLARQLTRSWAHDPGVAGASANTPFANYEIALRELHAIGSLLQSAAGNPAAGRTLLGVSQLSDANLAAALLTGALARHELQPQATQPLIDARAALNDTTTAFDQFDAMATSSWAAAYRQSGVRAQLSTPQAHVSRALAGEAGAIDVTADSTNTYVAIDGADTIQRGLLDEVVTNADAEAADIASTTRLRLAVIAAVVVIATALAWLQSRSITRRVRAVANNANVIATEQLPALVDALRDPRGRSLPEIDEVSTRGHDELAELATSFNSLQRTLHEVAAEQVSVLRRGVSDIFVTMARRNRSLVDRQLAMLDEFEAEVEDPEVLASYYHLDHLATRMRRNSESLLVLASAEPRRGRIDVTPVDTVVRAAVGEIEEYRRIQVEEFDPLRVRGNVVADVAHLLAELLDNATAFSPPETLVQIGGRLTETGYLIRIVDGGVGIAEHRLDELNDLLQHPPVVGLSVEPTLGMSVVSLLASKHGIDVRLTSGTPGLIVDVLLPAALFAGEATPAAEPGASNGLSIDDFAGSLGLPARNGTSANGHSHTEHSHEAAVLAALEADLAAEPEVDASLTARLTDAFDRSDLASSREADTFAPPTSDDDLPVRAGGAGAASAFQSFRAGARAATDDLAAAAAAADSASAVDPPAAAPVAWAEPSASGPAGLAPPPAFGAPSTPPTGEFGRPPAPPSLPVGPSAQPVAPAHAHPAPRPLPHPVPDLPTRNRAAAAAAFTPADESAGVADALSAFDALEQVDVATLAPPSLPTRSRFEPSYTADYGDDPTSEPPEVTGASPLGADELRARLRAFQSEFRTGQHTGRGDADHTDPPSTGADLA